MSKQIKETDWRLPEAGIGNEWWAQRTRNKVKRHTFPFRKYILGNEIYIVYLNSIYLMVDLKRYNHKRKMNLYIKLIIVTIHFLLLYNIFHKFNSFRKQHRGL